MNTMNLPAIVDRQSISVFFAYLMEDLHISFHPDTPFEDYDLDFHAIEFQGVDIAELQKTMDICFDLCNEKEWDIYEIALEALRHIQAKTLRGLLDRRDGTPHISEEEYMKIYDETEEWCKGQGLDTNEFTHSEWWEQLTGLKYC